MDKTYLLTLYEDTQKLLSVSVTLRLHMNMLLSNTTENQIKIKTEQNISFMSEKNKMIYSELLRISNGRLTVWTLRL